MKKKKMPSSKLSRTLSLLGTTAKISGLEISKKIKNGFNDNTDKNTLETVKTRIEQVRLLTENLAQLKGAAMKAGQFLSLELSDLLPKEATDILSQLHNEAPPEDYNVMEKVLKNELGEEGLKQLVGIETGHVASASIGQVYRANLDGEEVAVKIQYPNVAASIESDLKVLKNIANSFVTLSGRKMSLDSAFEEMTEMLFLEADYEHELKCQEKYQQLISKHEQYFVPKVLKDYSSKKVITMEWVDGLMFKDWFDQSPKLEDRQKIASMIMNLYLMEFYQWGFVQTDPNLGNFMIQTTPLKLVLLDFGSTKQYEKKFVEDYRNIIRTVMTKTSDETIVAAQKMGWIDERETDETNQKFYEMFQMALSPFRKENQPFYFNDKDFINKNRDTVIEFSKSLKFSPPPKELIFLHRKLGGVFNMIKTLDVKMDLTNFIEQVIN